jgi:hypothetical protein
MPFAFCAEGHLPQLRQSAGLLNLTVPAKEVGNSFADCLRGENCLF